MADDLKVKSLAKAMRVLDCFTVERPELGVSDIARLTGLQKSSVHNILTTFEQLGYIGRSDAGSKYHLGLGLLRYSYVITNHMGLHKLLLPYLKQIATETAETTYLGIPDRLEVLYIESCVGDMHVPTRNILGERAPMYCTGLGKIMLAHSPGLLEEMREPYAAFTPYTIVTKAALQKELDETAQRGYAVDHMEHEYGVTCVAIPLFAQDGRLACAISVSGPSPRFAEEDIPGIAARMQDVVGGIQYKL